MHTSTLKSYFQSTIKVTLFIALILQQLIMGFGGIGILSAYADTDAYGTTIQKTIINDTNTGVDFRIDWASSGSLLSGFILEDLFTPNLNFLSKNDSSIISVTDFSTGPNNLKWIFNTNITPGTTGSIFLNFSKNGTGQFTNTGQLYGTKDVCDIINNNNVVSTNFDVTPPNFVAPNHDVMIDKKEGICNPTSGIIPGGGGIFDPGMISGFQSIFNWNCTNTAPLSKYNLGDDVYYTLYIHNYGPSLVTQLAVADVFENKGLQFVSVSGNYFGQKSYVTGEDLLTFTNGFSLGVNRGAFVTLRFKVIADEYSPLNNEAKTRIMIGGPSQNTWSKIKNTYTTITFPGDTNGSNNVDSTQITVKSYDLAIQKSLIGGTETPGATVVYRLNFSNTGIARTDILIRDKFTFSGVKIQSWAGSPGLIVDIPPVFTAGDDFGTQFRQGIHLGSNSTGFINITVKLPTLSLWCVNPPAFRNLAAIGTNAGIPGEEPGIYINRNDSNITNNNALLSIAVLPAAMDPNCGVVSSPYDLRITKTADKATATEGDTVTYTLNVYNSGRSDKFIYLDDNITNGMIFDSIVVDPLRFMKWRDITNLKNDMLTNITWPDNYLYRDITSYSISIPFGNSFYNFDKDIYHIVNANPAGVTACQTLFSNGSMYQTSFAGVMSIFANRDTTYAIKIGLGMSVPEAIATTMADIYKSIWVYTQNQVNTNARINSTIASQANNCGYYAGYEYALAKGFSASEAIDWGNLIAGEMSSYMKNINNILNDNLISTLDKRLRLAGYNNHIPFSELFSLYTNSGQVRDEIHTLYQYPENTYVDLLQGNTNTRGPSYVVSGTDILYSNYSYGTSTYTNFGSFISTPHGTGRYSIPLYTPSVSTDYGHNYIYFQSGTAIDNIKNFFYVPANQSTQFKYKMIVGNNFNSGDIINNSATIAMCANANCIPGSFVYSSEIIPGANNTSNANVLYQETLVHYDLSGTNFVTAPINLNLGSPISYDATYCNNGPDTVANATITYNYDSRLAFVSSVGGTIGTPTNDGINHLLNWPGTRSLAMGECETITLNFTLQSLTLPQNNITTILHVGKELGIGLSYAGDTNISNNHVLEDFDINDSPFNGTASKSAKGAGPYHSGDAIIFTIAFTGQGNPTTIIDNYNNNVLIFNSATNGGILTGITGNQSVIWTNIDGTVVDSVQVSFIVKNTPGGFENTATITSSKTGYCSNETISSVYSYVTGDIDVSICGDGNIDIGEQCDDANGDNNDSCSNTCTLNAPSCVGVDFSPTAGTPGLLVTGTLPVQTGFNYSNLNWGEGPSVVLPLNIETHIFNSVGTFPISVQVSNSLSGSLTISCTGQTQISFAPINAICGSGDSAQVYTGTTPTDLCDAGNLTGLILSGNTWSWLCEGQNGGSNDSCDAPVGYCGDGIIGTGIGYSNQEQCDDGAGNGVNGTCSLSCLRQNPVCPTNLVFTGNNGVAPLNVTGLWYLVTGTVAMQLDWNDSSIQLNPISGDNHIYNLSGTYNPVLIIANSTNTGIQQSCTGTVIVNTPGILGTCGSKYNGKTVYSLNQTTKGLCPAGQTVIGFNFTPAFSGGIYTWQCNAAGGNSPLCSANMLNANGALPFNLAINKSITSTGPYTTGSTVNYRIDFYNDSADDQQDVNITDILPAGQQLITGSLVYYNSGFVTEIQTGASPLERNIDILYSNETGWIEYSTLITENTGTQINTVTIKPFTGDETIPYTGGICTPGHNPLSGADYAVPGTDNVDCEQIIVSTGYYDLALQKIYSTGNLVPGGRVKFIINVINQGTMTGLNITITDTYPSEFILNSVLSTLPWIASIGATNYTLPLLGVGQSTGLEIVFDIASNATPGALITNWAEISSDTGNDIDSTPDTIFNNDEYNWNNNISGNSFIGEDEDDHDPEDITILSPAPGGVAIIRISKNGDRAIYQSGDIINYTIAVYNEGNLGTINAEIAESYPTGFVYGGSSTSTGTYNSITKIWSIPYIEVGTTGYLYLSGILQGVNTQVNTATVVNGICSTCTDNWMTEPLTPNYDLSLNKILSGGNRTFLAGQQVTFTITVVNQSSVLTAHQFTFDDIIPVGLTLSDPDWTLNGNRAVSNFSGNLVPGGSYNKDITFTVNGSVFGTLTNRAEITIDDGFDYDSTPHNWTGLDVEDDDDSDYIVVVKPNNPGGTYTPVPTPTPPQCIGDSCNPVSQTPIITVIKKLLTNIRDVIFPQVKKSTPVKIPRTGVDVD